MDLLLIELFCHIDDFMTSFMPNFEQPLIANGLRSRKRESKLRAVIAMA